MKTPYAPQLRLTGHPSFSEYPILTDRYEYPWRYREIGEKRMRTNTVSNVPVTAKFVTPISTAQISRTAAPPKPTFGKPSCGVVTAPELVEKKVLRDTSADWPVVNAEPPEHFQAARIYLQRAVDDSIAVEADFEDACHKRCDGRTTVRVVCLSAAKTQSPRHLMEVDESDNLIDLMGAETENSPGTKIHETIMGQLRRNRGQQAHRGGKIAFTVVAGWPSDAICAETVREEGNATRWSGIFIRRGSGTVAQTDLECIGKANLSGMLQEPGIEVQHGDNATAGDPVPVRIRGVDVFEPSSGQAQSGATDGIATGFGKPEHSGKRFFVRQACFLRAGHRYGIRCKNLKATVKEVAQATPICDVFMPFPRTAGGRDTLKVSNHLGGQVMKVVRV